MPHDFDPKSYKKSDKKKTVTITSAGPDRINLLKHKVDSVKYTPKGAAKPDPWDFENYRALGETEAKVDVTPTSAVPPAGPVHERKSLWTAVLELLRSILAFFSRRHLEPSVHTGVTTGSLTYNLQNKDTGAYVPVTAPIDYGT